MKTQMALKITYAEFMAEPRKFIGLDSPVEVSNIDGSPLMFIAGRAPRRIGLLAYLDKKRFDLWLWWQCLGCGKGPLDTSWIE